MEKSALHSDPPPLWKAMLGAAMAGGLGWGIRGQYGHETGAMIAGLLVSLVLVLVFRPKAAAWPAARAVAWGTVAIGFGGSMTYGQTVGLTHDAALVGNWGALRWGMLGLAIKGSLWIGFGALFLGMGLGGVRYRAGELALVMLGVLGLSWLGIQLLNRPFDPAHKLLPALYFSDSWQWEPGATLKPRREVWGGFLFAFLGLLAYTGWRRRDALAPRLGLWGALGGAIGFPLGQAIQSYHAWNPEVFQAGVWVKWAPLINWWNFMETTFGATMGAMIGLGLWLNRRRISSLAVDEMKALPRPVEWGLMTVHVGLLVGVEFLSVGWIDSVYDFGLMLGFIPVVAVAGGRYWPYAVALPITVLPIAGKTVRQLVYQEHALPVLAGWVLYFGLPFILMTALALYFGRAKERLALARSYLGVSLIGATGVYFGLNYAFFHFPWPWRAWTVRTPNAIVFTVCAGGLIALAVQQLRSARTVDEGQQAIGSPSRIGP